MRRIYAFLCAGALVAVGCGDDSTSGNNNVNDNGNGNNNNAALNCGNGAVDPGETCDGTNYGGETCETLDYTGGTLACSATCQLDVTGCTGGENCGNAVVDTGEQCDGTNLDGETCLSLNYTGGTLDCRPNCQFDVTDCTGQNPCGNLVIDSGEQCDGTEFGTATCITEGFIGGELACTGTCQLDTGNCVALAGQVVINELNMGLPDYVELLNASNVTVDLDGWYLWHWGLDMGGDPFDASQVLPAYVLDPGDYVVIEDVFNDPAPIAEVVDPGLMNLRQNIFWAEDDPGACLLLDTSGYVDFVKWGPDTFTFPGAMDWADTPDVIAVLTDDTFSLGRIINGVDTDTAGDWCLQGETLGDDNAACFTALAQGAVLITEVDVGDGNQRDDAVELYNPGSAAVNLAGIVFEWYRVGAGPPQQGADILPSYNLGPGEYVVLIDDLAFNQDPWGDETAGEIHVDDISWSDTRQGAVVLISPLSDEGIDFVRWGDAITQDAVAPDTWDDTGARLPLIPGGTGVSLGRSAAGMTDTNTSADWCLMDLSLGVVNLACN